MISIKSYYLDTIVSVSSPLLNPCLRDSMLKDSIDRPMPTSKLMISQFAGNQFLSEASDDEMSCLIEHQRRCGHNNPWPHSITCEPDNMKGQEPKEKVQAGPGASDNS